MKFKRTYVITIESDPAHQPIASGSKSMEEMAIAAACHKLAETSAQFWQTGFENTTVKVEATK